MAKKGESKTTWAVARESNGNIQITFTIPFSEIRKTQDEVIRELGKDIEIPGFRKGTAPLNKVVDKIPQNTIIEHSLSHILPKALAEAITKEGLKIAIYPKFELIKAQNGEDWQVRGITCELPDIVLGDYKKIVAGATRASSLWTPEKGKPGEKSQSSRDEKEQMVIKALLDSVKVEVPQILIEEEADSRISNLLSRLEKLGLALESYLTSIGKSAEDLRADYAKQAKEAITLDLILNKVADSENLKIDPKEIETALSMSEIDKKKEDDNAEEIERRKRLLESILKRRTALDFLINLS
jgi:FKBP-type peptidyl-prolyl cis-trans isomerase (trigger factor)